MITYYACEPCQLNFGTNHQQAYEHYAVCPVTLNAKIEHEKKLMQVIELNNKLIEKLIEKL